MLPSAPRPCPAARPGWRTRLRRAAGRDGNPLRRPADRRRTRLGWAVLLLAALAVALSAVTAAAGYGAARRATDEQAARLHRVTATTLAAAQDNSDWAPGVPAQVPARWHYPADRARTGQVVVPAGTARGASVEVWVTDSGAAARPLRSTADLAAAAALTGFALLTGSALVCGTVLVVGRRRIDSVTAREWSREWEQVEPRWSGRSRSG